MIRVCFYRRANQTIGFAMNGHALYDREGKDIVCAAASALAINCINSVEVLTGLEKEDLIVQSGDTLFFGLRMTEGEKTSESAILLLDSLRIGLFSIRKEYPGHIEILTREV